MAGRKRKPDHLKIVSGTAQPCRMNPNAPEPSKDLPTAPAWLSERAAQVFSDLTDILSGMGLASADHNAMLAILASRIEEIELCTAIIEDLGRTYQTVNTQGSVMFRTRPEVAQRSDAMRHAQSLLSEFGLSPSALGKVSAPGKKDANPFEALA